MIELEEVLAACFVGLFPDLTSLECELAKYQLHCRSIALSRTLVNKTAEADGAVATHEVAQDELWLHLDEATVRLLAQAQNEVPFLPGPEEANGTYSRKEKKKVSGNSNAWAKSKDKENRRITEKSLRSRDAKVVQLWLMHKH